MISSIKVSVIKDSISPTAARMTEYGRMIHSVSSVSGGKLYERKNGIGKPARMLVASGSRFDIAASMPAEAAIELLQTAEYPTAESKSELF